MHCSFYLGQRRRRDTRIGRRVQHGDVDVTCTGKGGFTLLHGVCKCEECAKIRSRMPMQCANMCGVCKHVQECPCSVQTCVEFAKRFEHAHAVCKNVWSVQEGEM